MIHFMSLPIDDACLNCFYLQLFWIMLIWTHEHTFIWIMLVWTYAFSYCVCVVYLSLCVYVCMNVWDVCVCGMYVCECICVCMVCVVYVWGWVCGVGGQNLWKDDWSGKSLILLNQYAAFTICCMVFLVLYDVKTLCGQALVLSLSYHREGYCSASGSTEPTWRTRAAVR